MYDDNHIGSLYTNGRAGAAMNGGETIVGTSATAASTTSNAAASSCRTSSVINGLTNVGGINGIRVGVNSHSNYLPNHLNGLSLSPPCIPRHATLLSTANGNVKNNGFVSSNGSVNGACLSELSEKQQQQSHLVSPPAYSRTTIADSNNQKYRFFMNDVTVVTATSTGGTNPPSSTCPNTGDNSVTSNGVSIKSCDNSTAASPSPTGFVYNNGVQTSASASTLRPSILNQPVPPVTSPDLSLLKRISPDKLKFMLAPSELYAPDRAFLFGALICLRLFEKPSGIFDDVCAECFRRQIAIESSTSSRKGELLHAFSTHVVRLLSDWTDMLPADFADDASMGRLRVILERICLPNPHLKRNVLLLVKNLTIKLERTRRLTEQLSRLEAERVRRLVAGATAPSAASAADIYAACPDPSAVARQLTRVELDWLQRIEPSDVVDSFLLQQSSSNKRLGGSSSSMSSGSQGSSCNNLKSCSALKAYVDWFNRLSYLVASEICLHLKKKNRARIIDYFIDVARECLNLGNFNSPMAIIGGLNLPQIQRLKRTWALVDRQKFAVLEALTGPENNFSPYRSTLKAAQWRSSRGQGRVVIPFFSLFIRDLYYFWERCSESLSGDSSPSSSSITTLSQQQSNSSNGSTQNSPALRQESASQVVPQTKSRPAFIDFDRFLPLIKHLEQLTTWKCVDCPFAANDTVASYLLATPVLTDDSLFLASYACESPESHHEKERCKNLKSQIS